MKHDTMGPLPQVKAAKPKQSSKLDSEIRQTLKLDKRSEEN